MESAEANAFRIAVGCAIALGCLGPPACGSEADGVGSVGTSDASADAADSGADASPDVGPDVDASLADADAALDAFVDGCPPEMVRIDAFCVDRWEAHVVELGQDGSELTHSPYLVIPDGVSIRAKSAEAVVPQGYISQLQATEACENAGKRLCDAAEFVLACRGIDANDYYPYGGQTHEPGACNEGKGSAVALFHGSDPSLWTYDDFNDPALNMWDGGLALTGEFTECVSPFGVHDCVGNLHEWGSDAPDPKGHGRFRGGFYGDAEYNGHGCLYVTSAHAPSYHDYSTGFRCCRDAEGLPP
ncbi:MAG: SUMF1/EgtB/PvdO family nonheme iron enzyme [Polyangiaceae bacterium]